MCHTLSWLSLLFCGTEFEHRGSWLLGRYSTTSATLPALFCVGYFQDKVSWTLYTDWAPNVIHLISVSWVAIILLAGFLRKELAMYSRLYLNTPCSSRTWNYCSSNLSFRILWWQAPSSISVLFKIFNLCETLSSTNFWCLGSYWVLNLSSHFIGKYSTTWTKSPTLNTGIHRFLNLSSFHDKLAGFHGMLGYVPTKTWST
jgi:hypothetical protein